MTLLPRLLAGAGACYDTDLASRLEVNGPLSQTRRGAAPHIIAEVQRAGLRGRGGAGFPVAKKMSAVAAGRGAKVVVANGAEGEPASGKDRLLLIEVPHLVLDGAAVAARAVGARGAIVAFPDTADDAVEQALMAAVEERRRARLGAEPDFELLAVDDGFVTGHESALVNALSGGDSRPTYGPRPFERGVRRRPTLVQNVETLAHVALIARHGAGWFRQAGTVADPGSALITLSGAVAAPGVYEIEHGASLADLLAHAGVTEDLQAVLLGGYFGSWLPATRIPRLHLSPAQLRAQQASFGAGVIVALGRETCAVAETTRIAEYFAAQSSGQCGPCVFGLKAIADTMQQVASGTATARAGRDLTRWSSSLAGRGACQFPDGATRFVASALRVFADAFEDHLQNGPCEGCAGHPVLPVPFAVAV